MKMNKPDFNLLSSRKFWALSPDKADTNAANLYIYSDVQSDGTDFFTGKEVKSETSALFFKQELDKLGNVNQINVYIDSKGGDVGEGIGIYSQLKRHKAHKTAYIDGYACSIASVIPMACDEVVISPPATMMIHPAWSIAMGNAEALRKCADDLDKITEGTKQAYLHKSGGKINDSKLTELINAETWLTAEECIKYGFADRLLGDDEEPETTEPKPDDEKDKENSEIPDNEENSDGENPEEGSKEKPNEENPDDDEKDKDFAEKAMKVFGNFFM